MMFFGDYMHLLRATCRWREFEEHWPVVQRALDKKDFETLHHFRLSGIYWGFSMELMYLLSTVPPPGIYIGPSFLLFSPDFHVSGAHTQKKKKNMPFLVLTDTEFLDVPLYRHEPDARSVNKKLKVAYISSNYRNHAQGTQLSSFFKEHDRENFEIYAFSLMPALVPEAIKRRDYLKEQVRFFFLLIFRFARVFFLLIPEIYAFFVDARVGAKGDQTQR